MPKPSPPREIDELSEFLTEKFDEIYNKIEDLENSNNIVMKIDISFSGVRKEKFSYKRKYTAKQSKSG